MTFERGSLVLVDYTARLQDSDVVIDTTRTDDSTKLEDAAPGAVYQPRLVSVGDPSYPVLKGFDAVISQAELGVQQTVAVSPQEAYGERNRAKVRMVTIRKLGEDAEKVSVGDVVKIDNNIGVIRFIGSGRVQIDFNHRYAGKTVLYDFKVVKLLDSATEKIEAILNDAGVPQEPDSYALTDNKLEVSVPASMLRSDTLQNRKFLLQMALFQFVPDLVEVRFVETYKNAASDPQNKPESN